MTGAMSAQATSGLNKLSMGGLRLRRQFSTGPPNPSGKMPTLYKSVERLQEEKWIFVWGWPRTLNGLPHDGCDFFPPGRLSSRRDGDWKKFRGVPATGPSGSDRPPCPRG